MRNWLVLVVFSLAPFAGCLDDSDGGLLAARAALPRAESRASDWNNGAQLTGAASFEIGADLRAELRDELVEARADLDEERQDCAEEEDVDDRQECMDDVQELENELEMFEAVLAAGADEVGDGVSAVWAFVFQVPGTNDGLVVAVDARKVLFSQEVPADSSDGELGGPVSNWSIDSDEAAQAAAAGDEDYASGVGQASAFGFSFLLQGADRPYWLLGIDSNDTNAEVAVDATDGTLVPFEEVFGLLMPLYQEFGTAQGSFTAVVGTAPETEFDIEFMGHGALAIYVEVTPPPVAAVSVVVTDAKGAESSFAIPRTIGATSAEGSIVLTDVPAGSYQVQLSNQLATRENWNLQYCTDGEDWLNFGFTAAACDLVPQSDTTPTAASEMVSRWLNLLDL